MNEQLSLPQTALDQIRTPEELRPFPRAPPRKTTGGRKKLNTCILTDTPEKNRIAAAAAVRCSKKMRLSGKCKNKSSAVKIIEPKSTNAVDSSDSESSEADVRNMPVMDDSSDSDGSVCLSDYEAFDEDLAKVALKSGDFIIVNFSLKTSTVKYVGEIVNVTDDSELEVKFLRSKMSKKGNGEPTFVYPIIDDVSVVNKSDVVAKLPSPMSHGGTARVESHLLFPITLVKYNIR